MNVDEFRAQLEEELDWRTSEIRFFQNKCTDLNGVEQQDKFRRALILLLYSNFEGFCKFGLSLYVTAVNQEAIDCKDANYAIVAASLSDVFVTLRDGNKKAPEFVNDDPDDSKLHRFARDREFIERAFDLMARKVKIPDSAVDMESNLKPVVLRKNLYRLGLPHDQFLSLDTDINRLLRLRNNIAHGQTKQGIEEALYMNLRDSALRIMNEITVGLTRAFSEKLYLAKQPETV